jgi:asparagine synthase (glutamine-hydrolysing)
MCGITGIVSSGGVDRAFLSRMTGSLAHRGPDDEGVWSDPAAGVGLGHRRLAVIDLTPTGRQPMKSGDGQYVLTFNGEIYNHAALRAEIEADGRKEWRGRCDTETLIEAIACWGLERALSRCVGMFALALWDRRDRKLFLARDRFGEKPLYYGRVGKDFLFASELKAIRIHPAFANDIDRVSLRLFAACGYVPAPRSIFEGIFKLEPGSILTLDIGREAGGATPRIDRYWSYRAVVENGLANPIPDEAAAVDELESTLAAAIKGQSVADVPIGTFLSGGVDSSTIVALSRKYISQNVRTYSIGFEEERYNEAHFAKAVAGYFGTDHHERYVTAKEAQEVIPQLPVIYDEPFGDPAQIPTLLMSSLAREKVIVALSGDGGDELFGGYGRYVAAANLWGKLRRLPFPVRRAVGSILNQVPSSAWDRLAAAWPGRHRWRFAGARLRRTLQRVEGAKSMADVYRSFRDEWTGDGSPATGASTELGTHRLDLDLSGAPDLVRMMYCDAVSYLPGDLLCKVDRATMAFGLEDRIPFLDHRVADVAARIDVGMKIRGKTGKHILRKLLSRHAPTCLFERPKAGFSVPVGEWIKGPLRPWTEDLLARDRLDRQGYFSSDMVHRRWQDHLEGRRDATWSLWPILMFQAWTCEQESQVQSSSSRLLTGNAA